MECTLATLRITFKFLSPDNCVSNTTFGKFKAIKKLLGRLFPCSKYTLIRGNRDSR